VPSSCCQTEYSNNRQCGYGVRNKTTQLPQDTRALKIYQEGCLPKGEQWLKYHILPVSIAVICLAVLQVSTSTKTHFLTID
jgi:hypothetical protein